ncbi:hypothetical protein [Carnobacterium divergens]|uniref:hypothetical protein n=1 Tax=Carnobacterium divergens TaxID=2748 RepID=UPI00186B73B9|nr:hypothetical protein [Carnobacterium divergens]
MRLIFILKFSTTFFVFFPPVNAPTTAPTPPNATAPTADRPSPPDVIVWSLSTNS